LDAKSRTRGPPFADSFFQREIRGRVGSNVRPRGRLDFEPAFRADCRFISGELMRVLLVTPEYPPHIGGGILKYYALLTAAWAAAGAEVTVLVSTPFSSFEDYEHHGAAVRFVSLDAVNRHADHLTHLAAAPMFRRCI